MFVEHAFEVLRPEAERRQRGGLLFRLFDHPPYSRKAYMAAVHELLERFYPEQQEQFRTDGTLPPGFWKEVDRIAGEWDSMRP